MKQLTIIDKKIYNPQNDHVLKLNEHIILVDDDKNRVMLLKMRHTYDSSISSFKALITQKNSENILLRKSVFSFEKLEHQKNGYIMTQGFAVDENCSEVEILEIFEVILFNEIEEDLLIEASENQKLEQISLYHRKKDISSYVTLMFFILFVIGIIIAYYFWLANR